MDKSKESLIEQLLSAFKSPLLKVLYYILGPVLVLLQPFAMLGQIESRITARIALAAIVLLIYLSAYCLRLRNRLKDKPNPNHYDFINPPGFYKHKKKGIYYCQPCLDRDNRLSPISWFNPAGLICRICGDPYPVDLATIVLFPGLQKELLDASVEIESNPEYQKFLTNGKKEWADIFRRAKNIQSQFP